MNTKVYVQDEVAVIKPEQKALFGSDRQELNTEVQELINNGTSNVALDLDGINWLDSTTLGILTEALKLTREAGGDLRLAGVNAKLTSVFVVTNLKELFQFFETADDGVASYAE